MPNVFARCVNTDYCSLGDRRLVMRLDEGEPLYCPECAQHLVPAPPWGQRRIPWPVLGALAMGAGAMASGYLVALQWPRATSYLTSAAIAFSSTPAREAQIGSITSDGGAFMEPSAAKLFLAAAMDEYLPPAAGDFVLRPRRARPPRLDRTVIEAIAALEAGVPPVPWPEDDDTDASMPWRQALIMAALVSPGQPLAAVPPLDGGQPTEAVEAPTPTMSAAPAGAPAPIAAPPPQRPGLIRHGVRPQAALQEPVPQAAAQEYEIGHAQVIARNQTVTGVLAKLAVAVANQAAPPDSAVPVTSPPRTVTQPPTGAALPAGDELAAYRGGANIAAPDQLAMQGDLTGLIMPMPQNSVVNSVVNSVTPEHATVPTQPAAIAPQRATEVPPILRAPKAPTAIATLPEAAAPRPTLAARTGVATPGAHMTVAQKQTVPAHGEKKLARHESAPKHLAKNERPQSKPGDKSPAKEAAPAPVAVTSGGPADDSRRDEAAATPHAKIVVVPSGFSMSYTPLKDVNLTSIVMPARPVADTPRMGSLKVDCEVETNGLPSDCHVVHAERAAAVSSALLAWMGSGLVHRAPTMKDGHPVRARQSWTLAFPAEARRAADTTAEDTP